MVFMCFIFTAITCVALDDPLNGATIYNMDADAEGNYPFGTVANFICTPGHRLNDEALSRRCIGDGSTVQGYFDGEEPLCEGTNFKYCFNN